MPAPKGNQYAIGNKGGRPPKFKSAKHLAKKVDQYFCYIEGESSTKRKKIFNVEKNKFEYQDVIIWNRKPEPATITGLVLFLGFNSRQSLNDYEEMNEEYSDVIKRARTRISHEYEKKLSEPKPTGSIFALKNMGWTDNRAIELSGDPDRPMQMQTNSNVDYSKLSDEVLEAIAKARKTENG